MDQGRLWLLECDEDDDDDENDDDEKKERGRGLESSGGQGLPRRSGEERRTEQRQGPGSANFFQITHCRTRIDF